MSVAFGIDYNTMGLVKLLCCLLLISTGASAGFLSNLKSKSLDSEATNKNTPVESSQSAPGDTEKDKVSKAEVERISQLVREHPQLEETHDNTKDYDYNHKTVINDGDSKMVARPGKSKKHKTGEKDFLPDDPTKHPVQVVSSTDSVPIPENDETQDLHIVPQKEKKKPGSEPTNNDEHDSQNTVAVITEEKLDAAVENLKDKQSKSPYKDPALKELIERAKEVKSERAYLKKLVLGYSATQAFLSATNVIPFRDPIIFTVIKIVTYLKNSLEKPLSERYAEHQRVYSSLVTELVKNNPKYSSLITKMPKKLIIKTKDGKDIVVDIIDEKEALREDKLQLEKMNFVSLFRTGMQMK